jgi:hypothetical protein
VTFNSQGVGSAANVPNDNAVTITMKWTLLTIKQPPSD